jgi:uncharacterized membrane protein YeiH
MKYSQRLSRQIILRVQKMIFFKEIYAEFSINTSTTFTVAKNFYAQKISAF